MNTLTYFRPINADTGKPTLATYFTAPLCQLADAYQHDLEARTNELAADVRDHLDQLGIAIRPTIIHGRVRIVQEVDDEEETANAPEVISTVMAFLTDAEPDDPALAVLADGFRSERLGGVQVVFEIPTTASERELERAIAADRARGAAYIAKAAVEDTTTAAAAAPAVVSGEVLDDLFG